MIVGSGNARDSSRSMVLGRISRKSKRLARLNQWRGACYARVASVQDRIYTWLNGFEEPLHL